MAIRKREVDIAKGKAVGVEVRIPLGTNTVDEVESVSSAGVVSDSPRYVGYNSIIFYMRHPGVNF